MMNNPKPISEFLVPGKRTHLVGIGGVSMCPLAEVLAGKGLLVQGKLRRLRFCDPPRRRP